MNFDNFRDLTTDFERLKFLLQFALAAPSSHNTQPWQFRIRDRTIELWGARRRMLPASDSNHRQFFLSLGCALENLLLAADYYGLTPNVRMFPDPNQNLWVATTEFPDMNPRRQTTKDHLATKIFERHTNRYDYGTREVPERFLASLRDLETKELRISVVRDPAVKQEILKTVGDATEAAFHDKGFTRELSHWIKPSLKRYRDGMPGYNIGIPWPVSFLVPLAIRYLNVAKQQRQMVEGPLRSTPVFIVFSTRLDDPRAWVETGRILERVWLMAATQGLKLGPSAAVVQIGDFYKKIQDVLGLNFRPQAFARLGYQEKIPVASPRLRLEEVVIK